MNFEVFHGGKKVDITTQDRVKEAQLKPFLNRTHLHLGELYFNPKIRYSANAWFQNAMGIENGLLHVRNLLLEAEQFDPSTTFYLPDDPSINHIQLKDDVNAELGSIPFYTTYNFPVYKITSRQTLMTVDNTHNLVCTVTSSNAINTIDPSLRKQPAVLDEFMKYEVSEDDPLYSSVINDHFYFQFNTPQDSFGIKYVTEKSSLGFKNKFITCGLSQNSNDFREEPPYFQDLFFRTDDP